MRLLGNFLSLAGAEVVSKVVTFAAFAYLARVAGPERMGCVEFAAAMCLCAGLVIDLGFSPYGAREIAKSPERTAELVSEIVLARMVLALAACAAVIAIALWLDRSPLQSRLLLIYGLSLLPTPFLLQWVFQGHEQMQTVAIATLVRQTAFAVAVFAVVHTPTQVWLVGAAELIGVSCAAVYCFRTYRRRFTATVRWRLRLSRQLFRDCVPMGLSQMFWAARFFGGTLVLGLIATPEDVGFFGTAMRILVALHAFVWLYYFNLLPTFTRAWHARDGSTPGLADLIGRSLHGVVWVGAGATLVGILAARDIMTLAYGRPFAPGGAVLQWFAGVCLAAAISGHYRFALIATGRQSAEMVSAALGSVTALALIPIGYTWHGPTGAAMGLFVAELMVWGSSWWYGRHLLNLRGHMRHLIRPLAALLLVLGVMSLLPLPWPVGRPLVAGATLAVLAYASDAAVRSAGHRPLEILRHRRRNRTI